MLFLLVSERKTPNTIIQVFLYKEELYHVFIICCITFYIFGDVSGNSRFSALNIPSVSTVFIIFL